VIAKAFFYVVLAGIGVVAAVTICALVTYFFQTDQMALDLMQAAIFNFNGVLVGAVGYGLLAFVYLSGKRMVALLNGVLEVPDEYLAQYARYLERTTSVRWWLIVVAPLSAVGATVLWYAGFPLAGWARLSLAVGVMSIYIVASAILASYIYTLLLFQFIEEHTGYSTKPRIRLKCSFASMDLQAIDSFFIVSATLGVISIYLGFRGTLTANFVGTTELFGKLMILPLVFYLPATLCYSFYPRHVLRQATECDTLELVAAFEEQAQNYPRSDDFKSTLELRALIFDIKEKMLSDRRAVPLLTLKDAPSLTMSFVIIMQFIAQNDSVVSNFFSKFFK
jgi:hypothetical protein